MFSIGTPSLLLPLLSLSPPASTVTALLPIQTHALLVLLVGLALFVNTLMPLHAPALALFRTLDNAPVSLIGTLSTVLCIAHQRTTATTVDRALVMGIVLATLDTLACHANCYV